MNIRNLVTTLLAMTLACLILVDESNAFPKAEKIHISGTVISYNIFSRLTIIVGQMPRHIEDHTQMLVRVNKISGDLEEGQYIKLRFTNSDNPTVNVPQDMLEHAQQWQFALTRDEACDQSAEDLLYAMGKNGKESNQSWKLVAGAEREQIPEDISIPCYVFGTSDFRKMKALSALNSRGDR